MTDALAVVGGWGGGGGGGGGKREFVKNFSRWRLNSGSKLRS